MWYQHAIVCAKHFANIVPYHLQEGKNLYMKEEIELKQKYLRRLESPFWITAIVCDLLGNGLWLPYTYRMVGLILKHIHFIVIECLT